jgi:hypothetical protein
MRDIGNRNGVELLVVVAFIALILTFAALLWRGQQRVLANRLQRQEHEHERLMAIHRPDDVEETPARRRDRGATIMSREPRIAVHAPGVGV